MTKYWLLLLWLLLARTKINVNEQLANQSKRKGKKMKKKYVEKQQRQQQ